MIGKQVLTCYVQVPVYYIPLYFQFSQVKLTYKDFLSDSTVGLRNIG